MDLLSNLRSIGFTEYEARVFLALLSEYPTTGYQLSIKAGIPRSMVYEALGRLHARGAVLKVEEGRTTLYRPLPPSAILDRYEQEHQRLLSSLRDGLDELFQAQEEDRLWTITGRQAILSYAGQMIQRAEDEVSLVLADLELIQLHQRILESHARGVSIQALLTGIESLATEDLKGETGFKIAHHPPQESELQQLNGTLVIAVDGKECLIANTENKAGEPGSSIIATVTNNRNLTLIVRQFVWMELYIR